MHYRRSRVDITGIDQRELADLDSDFNLSSRRTPTHIEDSEG